MPSVAVESQRRSPRLAKLTEGGYIAPEVTHKKRPKNISYAKMRNTRFNKDIEISNNEFIEHII
jgi:hypothetical protein